MKNIPVSEVEMFFIRKINRYVYMDYLFTHRAKNKFFEQYYSNEISKPFVLLEDYLDSGLVGERPLFARFDADGNYIEDDYYKEYQFNRCCFLFMPCRTFNKGTRKNVSVNKLYKDSYFIFTQACVLFCLNYSLGRFGDFRTTEFQYSAFQRFSDCIISVLQVYFSVFGNKEQKEKFLGCFMKKWGMTNTVFTVDLLKNIENIAKQESLKNIKNYYRNRKTFTIYNKFCREDKELFRTIKNKHKLKTMKLHNEVKIKVVALRNEGYTAKEIVDILSAENGVNVSVPTIYKFYQSLKENKTVSIKDKRKKEKELLFQEISDLYSCRKLKSVRAACEYYFEKTGKTISRGTMTAKINKYSELC